MQRSGNLEMQMMLQEEEAKQALRDFRNALKDAVRDIPKRNMKDAEEKANVINDNVINACAKLFEFSEKTDSYDLKTPVKKIVETLSKSDKKKLGDTVDAIFSDPEKLGKLTDAVHLSAGKKASSWEDWGDMDEKGIKLNREAYKQPMQQTKEERIEARWDDVRIKLGDEEHLAHVLAKYLIKPDYHEDSLLKLYAEMGNVDDNYEYSFSQEGEKIIALLDEDSKQRLEENIRQLSTDLDKLEIISALNEKPEEKDNNLDNDPDEQQSDQTPRLGT